MTVHEHVVPRTNCPNCGFPADRAGSLEEAPPGPGDLCVCLWCLAYLRYREDMSREALPDADYIRLPHDVALSLSMARDVAETVRQQLKDRGLTHG